MTSLPLLFCVLTVLGSASALDASAYTINVGDKGPWTTPDDTPAKSYIDDKGKYWYQSAHALYGSTDPRKWQFWSGRDIGSATKDAVSNAVNPSNPNDSNKNTAWRCNNSPTGLKSSYAPGSTSHSERNYCDLTNVWVDPDTGHWIGLVHNEFTPQPFGDGLHYDSIDVAISKDSGATWSITDQVITSQYPTIRGDNTTFPQQTYHWGGGDPRLTPDIASGYFYVTYGSRVVNKGAGGWNSFQGHVARAPMSGKLAAGTWQKWYNGKWSEPGVGGKYSSMWPVDGTHSTGYIAPDKEYNPNTPGTHREQVAAGKLSPTGDLFVMDVTWNAYLGLWFGEPQNPDQTGKAPQKFYATDDLTTQKWTLIGDTGSYHTASWYRWLLDGATATGQDVVGKSFRAYCSFGCSNGASGEYVQLTIDTTAPAKPLDTSKAYTISGSGGKLNLSGGAASFNTTGSQVTFVPTGDGAYLITAHNAALGVDSSSDAGRAWGAVPTIQSGKEKDPGFQWWIIQSKSSDDNSLTGTVRLVNRYSGLALASAAHGIETAPLRSWDDKSGSAVGGGRKAEQQLFTLTA